MTASVGSWAWFADMSLAHEETAHGRRVQQRISFVTVVFEAELDLLRLQARAFDRFADPGMVDDLLVIDNTRTGIRAGVLRRLLDDYGAHRSKVTFLRPREIAVVPRASGWITQQILKILVYERINSNYYVVLDAKNHLIRPVAIRDFLAADGRARGGFHSYASHPLRPQLELVLSYLGLEPGGCIERFPPTHTPFVMQTQLVRGMVEDMSRRSSRDFAAEFVRSGVLEFFLYSGWILKTYGTWDPYFDGTPVRTANVWPGRSSASDVAGVITEASQLNTPFFAAHRTAVAKASPLATAKLARFWYQRGLFHSLASAFAFIGSFKIRYLVSMSLRRLRAGHSGAPQKQP